jgi:hypothetical protein
MLVVTVAAAPPLQEAVASRLLFRRRWRQDLETFTLFG